MNRLERTDLKNLQRLGVAISGLKAKIEGATYDGHLISFSSGPISAKIQIGASDMILLSRGDPLSSAVWRGTVSEISILRNPSDIGL